MSTRYRYGPVSVRSTIEFPELPSAFDDEEPAVEIEYVERLEAGEPQWYHAWVDDSGAKWLRIGRDRFGYRLDFPGLAQFAFTPDRRHVCARRADASPETFRHLLLDQVLPLVLGHDGWCVLHASAVATPGGAAAFLGNTGHGKSTVTASLAAAGLAAISDDTLILSAPSHSAVMAHPAYPSIRMWPESAEAIFGTAFRHEGRVWDYNDKVRIGRSGGLEFLASGTPLGVLYVLTPDGGTDRPRVEEIPPRDRIIDIVRHAFVLDWTGADRLRAAFDTVARVVDQVRVRRLRFRHDYAGLPALREVILEDLQRAA